MDEKRKTSCDYWNGQLPSCAPLSVPFVAMQQCANPQYEPSEALARGTLFPGLDLPFMNMVNTPPEVSTPMRELMALDFVLKELELYLDTHEDDKEAFASYQKYLRLAKEGRDRYIEMYGPVQQTDMLGMKSYVWLENPWPWDYSDGGRNC